MKKLLLLAVLGMTLGCASGCHIGECWRSAWNSRFHPERNAPAQQQIVVGDSCDPCDPCSGGTTVVTPGCR
jgi:hypothetical protein